MSGRDFVDLYEEEVQHLLARAAQRKDDSLEHTVRVQGPLLNVTLYALRRRSTQHPNSAVLEFRFRRPTLRLHVAERTVEYRLRHAAQSGNWTEVSKDSSEGTVEGISQAIEARIGELAEAGNAVKRSGPRVGSRPPGNPLGVDPRTDLLNEYDQVNQNVRALTDVRFKLLAFLPLLSTAAIYVLTGASAAPGSLPALAIPLLAALGFLATLGITIYDQRTPSFTTH